MNPPIERRAITIDAETKDMIKSMHFILMDEDVGIRKQVKSLNAAVYGNGKCGLKTQVLLVWVALGLIVILGVDNPVTKQMLKWVGP